MCRGARLPIATLLFFLLLYTTNGTHWVMALYILTFTRQLTRLLLVYLAFAYPVLAFAIDLHSDTETATAGYYQLTWQQAGQPRYQLEEAIDKTFAQTKTIYEGSDTATIVSGRANGTYYYRVRALTNLPNNPWSTPVTVEVKHHSLARAAFFFSLGAIVFLATLVTVVIGYQSESR